MTDKEIIKALECCTQQHKCNECPYLMEHHLVCNHHLHKDTLDLINRQQAEIERLSNSAKQWEYTAKGLFIGKQTAKAEAIKEFAERLKEKLHLNGVVMGSNCAIVEDTDIDNLVKEMVCDN